MQEETPILPQTCFITDFKKSAFQALLEFIIKLY